ncbi:MAG: hypothetical protein LBI74_07505 [Synergistaceae bacterium]|jgi:hypothetical protein|nr:hypothetical protein [Synergistaceae bacterium]
MRVIPFIVSLDGISKSNGAKHAERSVVSSREFGAADNVEVSSHKIVEVDNAVGPENLNAADSLINDANILKNLLDFAKREIISNADTSLRGQANMSQQSIMELF